MRYAPFALLGACLLVLGCSRHAPTATLVITNVTVVDVRTGSLQPARDLFIDGDSIVALLDAGSASPGAARVVDGSGRYAIPGLWDMHVHVLWQDSIPEMLLPGFVAAGVTGVRDMGGTEAGLADARRLEHAPTPYPRVVASGPVLDGPQPVDPSISIAVGDPEGAVDAVDSLRRLGADFIKVYTLLPADAFHAAATRAREVGLTIAGHVPDGVSIPEAARAGMRSIEHLREELEPFCTRADAAACDSALIALREHDVWQTPTLVVLDAKTRLLDDEFADPVAARALPPVVREMWTSLRESRVARDSAYWAMRADRWRDIVWLTGRLHAAGVRILAGTDTPVLFTYPGESLHRELELLVEAGLTPADALRAATLEPAAYLGESDRMGTIDAGMVADVVLLDANPLEDIGATRSVTGVVLRGRWLDRAALDGLVD